MSIRVPCRIAPLGVFVLLIGCTHDPVVDSIKRLDDPAADVRRAAVLALSEQPADDRVTTALTKCAADTDVEVRYLSIEALGKLGPGAKSSLPALKPALNDADKSVRLQAALAIHKIEPQDRSFMPILTTAMREGDGKTLLAVGAMGVEGAWAIPTLVQLLAHQSPQVRALAAKDLGRIGPAASSAKPALQAVLGDPNAAVKRAAQEALSRIQ